MVPAQWIFRQFAADIDNSPLAGQGKLLIGELQIKHAAIISEELDILAAKDTFERRGWQPDLAGTDEAGRPIEEALEIISGAGYFFAAALEDAFARYSSKITHEFSFH